MRENCTSGSVRGAARKGSPYRGGIMGNVRRSATLFRICVALRACHLNRRRLDAVMRQEAQAVGPVPSLYSAQWLWDACQISVR
jgi:hypothetical protein